MSTFYLVQHAEKQRRGGDPGLTVTGRAQALWTGSCLRGRGVSQVWSSPLRRARETAEIIAAVLGLPVHTDPRLRERMNWDGCQPLDAFFGDWDRSTRDRDFQPLLGDSSREAGGRFAAFLAEHQADRGRMVIVSHGGVTVDLLRTLYGDERFADRPELLRSGVPACAITQLSRADDGFELDQLADDGHLHVAEAPTGAFTHQVGGYRPRWLYSAREILDVHGGRLSRLAGQPLTRTWLLWDQDLDEWYAEGPVVLEFPDTRLTVCHRRSGECSMSWDDLDPDEPVDAGDESLRLSWRDDPLPPLSAIAGVPLRVIDLIEQGDPDGRWMIDAVEFGFGGAHLRLSNCDGRNTLSSDRGAASQARRRTRVG
ncbi:MAG: histidine phosphatase family protein [Actinocatenispora sp.]